MDVKRLFLIISLALVSYLMVVQWNKDYGPQAQAPVVQNTLPSEASSGNDLVQEDIPQNSTRGDLPNTSEASTSLIEVRTNVLDLRIDPKGGDIVFAALPEHLAQVSTSDTPFVLLERSKVRTYVAQSGLAGVNGPDASRGGRPLFSAEKTSYELTEGENSLQVDLNFVQSTGVQITKRFTLKRDSYNIRVEYLVNNAGSETWSGYYFAQLKRDNSPDPTQAEGMGMVSYLGAAISTANEKYEKITFEDIQEADVKRESVGGWVAMIQHYFVSAWIPDQNIKQEYSTRSTSRGDNIVGFSSPETVLQPGEQVTLGSNLYVGPKVQEQLESAAPNLELTVDFGWLWFIAQPLFWMLNLLHGFLGNWGWSIIILTVMIKAAFFHLSASAYRSMANMRRVGPELQRMKEKYGEDRQKMSQAMMELYKKEKINPIGGCLPILIQMPVFIALYWMLMESVELRHAPFMLWIEDLSVKDPYFVLPIIMGASMFIQQLLNPTPPDPMQAKLMKALPVVFTVFFLWFPAGLVLYWVVNNVLSIAQQYVITKRIEEGSDDKKAKA
ncbi:membrane protein insertase YidC [Oceanospirillum linum]|uniref:Membrane protein insertase YidC n=1 Tax=Oceanospirillum linum TaxID=966 RepID=A0A1T1HC12_OCELI|nr:membrane protein insertase YidC [Oceanospirillum linum]OOV87365.1 membrane protein insertase YidC [Oceanospirillum linum]SEF82803.1 protein translocase subunit yidC [Oleiphilus messinensis]SMP19512.1 protein translocase subunit yidC [Oceanospirillum linum]